jgi:hypothetical protein
MDPLSIPHIIYEWIWSSGGVTQGKQKELEKNRFQDHIVHHKSHMDYSGLELGPPRLEA